MHKRTALNGLAIVSLACGAAAHAEVTPGFYAGASVGESSIEIEDVDFDGGNTSFKVFGGYSFNQNFALEAAVFDGGNAEENFGGGSVGVELKGLNASAVGRLPLGEIFTLFGKVGFASYDVEVTARVNNSIVFAQDGGDEDLSYGIGGEFNFGRSFGFRAEYEVVDASDAEFNLLSLGGIFRF